MEAPGSYETLMRRYKPVTGKLKTRRLPDFVLWVCKCVSLTYSVSKEAANSLAAEPKYWTLLVPYQP